MSNDKKGIKIKETDDSISISAETDFSISPTYGRKILDKINEKQNKPLRIKLSSKGKFFSDTFFNIRKAIIDNALPNVSIRVNNRRSFVQINTGTFMNINTPSYEAELYGSNLKVVLKQKLRPYDDDLKELIGLVKSTAPKSLTFLSFKGYNEDNESFERYSQDLQHYLVNSLQNNLNVSEISFYVSSRQNLVGYFARDNAATPVPPIVKSKHNDELPTDDNQNTKE